jgi:hypothetical protein
VGTKKLIHEGQFFLNGYGAENYCAFFLSHPGELDGACSLQNVFIPSTSSNTRVTRSTRARSGNQSLEVISPVLSKRSKRQASKVS